MRMQICMEGGGDKHAGRESHQICIKYNLKSYFLQKMILAGGDMLFGGFQIADHEADIKFAKFKL